MDIMIENDTSDTHWQLSPDDSNSLLEFLFPDNVIFLREKGQLANNSGYHSMAKILKFCTSEGLYQRSKETKQQHWPTAPCLDPEASTQRKHPLAVFFNEVLECVKKACSSVEYKRVIFSLILGQSVIYFLGLGMHLQQHAP